MNPTQYAAIKSIGDPGKARVMMFTNGQPAHASLNSVAAGAIHGATAKATPVDADEFGYYDSVGAGPVKATWANIKAAIWSALGALIAGGTAKTTPVDGDMFAIADSAASNATKSLSWANLKATIKSNLALREVLTANRTYYVRTDGNDSNNGLADTAGGAFLTIQQAVNTACALDLSIYTVTIQCRTGTGGSSPITLKSYIGNGPITLQGDTVTPSNVTISTTSANCINATNVIGKWALTGLKFATTTSGYGISAIASQISVGVVEFGACATGHIDAEQGANVTFLNNYTISGGSTRHWFATTMALIQCTNLTITLTGTPAFSTAFLVASRAGGALISGDTFTGSATGTRYIVSFNAWADTAGAGATYLPGSIAGSTASGGQYA